MDDEDALFQFEASTSNHHLPDGIFYSRLPGLAEAGSAAALNSSAYGAGTSPSSIGDLPPASLSDEANLPLYPTHRCGNPPVPGCISEAIRAWPYGQNEYMARIVEGHHDPNFDSIFQEVDQILGDGRINIDVSPDRDSNENSMATTVVAHHDSQFDEIFQELVQILGDGRINIDVSPDRDSDLNSNEAAHMVAASFENLEPIIIESEDLNSSTISELSASPDLPLDDEETEPPSKLAKIELPTRNDDTDKDNDGQTCCICLEGWTSSGEHRLSALKCGHLFGHSCINRWLKQTTRNNRWCPSCKSRARNKDIRFIYAKRITVVDNSEIESLKMQLERTKSEINRFEMELHKAKFSQKLLFFNL